MQALFYFGLACSRIGASDLLTKDHRIKNAAGSNPAARYFPNIREIWESEQFLAQFSSALWRQQAGSDVKCSFRADVTHAVHAHCSTRVSDENA